MFELVELLNDPEAIKMLVLHAVLYLGAASLMILGMKYVCFHVLEWIHTKHPRIRNPLWGIQDMSDEIKPIFIFATIAVVAIIIISLMMDSLPVPVAVALWILTGWIIIWNYPNSGLRHVENFIVYGLITPISDDVAEIISNSYYYTRNRIVYGCAVFFGLKYVLSAYAMVNTPYVEEVIFFAIIMHFAWYFPFVGPYSVWMILPKKWITKYESAGHDLPADLSFSVERNVAHIKISNSAIHLNGIGKLNIVRGISFDSSFQFEVKPGEDFETSVDLSYNSKIHPWYVDLTLSFTGPKLGGTRTFYPENRGPSQSIMERVYSLPQALNARYLA